MKALGLIISIIIFLCGIGSFLKMIITYNINPGLSSITCWILIIYSSFMLTTKFQKWFNSNLK